MIPMSYISNIIYERKNLKSQVVREVAQSWGEEQLLSGPVLVIPYSYPTTSKDKIHWNTTQHIILPDSNDVSISTKHTTRKRSIYNVDLYEAEAIQKGSFSVPTKLLKQENDIIVNWDQAYIACGITDVSGIIGEPHFLIDGQQMKVTTGAHVYQHIKSGISIQDLGLHDKISSFSFSFDFAFKGNHQLAIYPHGKQVKIKMKSTWPNPSFVGSFPTYKHNIDETGFNAEWVVGEFNRNHPNDWSGDKFRFCDQWVGVNYIQMVDDYQKNVRSVKYALLIVSLSFMLFFFFEIFSASKMHPIQYGLIGIALIIFYSLLLSFTEHLGFDLAYWIASIATIGLIVFYCAYIFKSKGQIFLLAGLLSMAYSYIYIILQLEEFSLLVGSIGLFIVLATIMYTTRKINYYALEN